MEIIARFPCLPKDAPRPVESAEDASFVKAATVGEVVAPVEAMPAPPVAAVRRRRSRTSGGMVQPQFPVRSVTVLFVLAIVMWSFALRSDAARRQSARMARANPAGVVK